MRESKRWLRGKSTWSTSPRVWGFEGLRLNLGAHIRIWVWPCLSVSWHNDACLYSGMAELFCILALGVWARWFLKAHWLASLAETANFIFTERACCKAIRQQVLEEGTALACTCTHWCTHGHAPCPWTYVLLLIWKAKIVQTKPWTSGFSHNVATLSFHMLHYYLEQ